MPVWSIRDDGAVALLGPDEALGGEGQVVGAGRPVGQLAGPQDVEGAEVGAGVAGLVGGQGEGVGPGPPDGVVERLHLG